MVTNVGNTKDMKQENLKNIFRLIFRESPISRKDLADETEFSQATISNHVKTLINNGYVIEKEKGYSTGGRKPVFLTINPDKNYILSLDIKVDKVNYILFNLKFENKVEGKFFLKKSGEVENVINLIFEKIDGVIAKNDVDFSKILGIGVSVPGLLDKEKKVLEFAPNLEWKDVEIVKKFKEKYDLPIVLENEANAAAIGEKDFVYPKFNNMVYVSINEGIGCGIIINDSLYRGASGNAGEYGHLIIDRNGPKCHCGSRGCWETMASENYIIKSYKDLYDVKEIRKEDIYKSGKNGNDRVRDIFRKTGGHIGIGLVNIINSLSPQRLIIGGSITEIKEFIDQDLRAELEKEALPSNLKSTTVNYSELGDLAPIYGTAFMIFNNYIDLEKK